MIAVGIVLLACVLACAAQDAYWRRRLEWDAIKHAADQGIAINEAVERDRAHTEAACKVSVAKVKADYETEVDSTLALSDELRDKLAAAEADMRDFKNELARTFGRDMDLPTIAGHLTDRLDGDRLILVDDEPIDPELDACFVEAQAVGNSHNVVEIKR